MSTLHENGEINLDSSLTEFLPNLAYPDEIPADLITLRHLLSQSSGISNQALEHRLAYTGLYNQETLWDVFANTQLNEINPLGTFEYTNSNFNILAMLIEEKLGKTWKEILIEEIFQKAGMSRTTPYMSQIRDEGWSYARPHKSIDVRVPKRTYLEKTDATMHSAGGIYMSADDAAKWLELLVTNGTVNDREVIPKNAVIATYTAEVDVDNNFGPYKRESYGLGFYLGPYIHDDQRWVHHFGGFAGASAHVSFMPDKKIGVAVFANDNEVGARFIHLTANYIYDELLERDTAVVDYEAAITDLIALGNKVLDKRRKKSEAQLGQIGTISEPFSSYSGEYFHRLYGTIEISVTNDNFFVKFGNLQAQALPHSNKETVSLELVPGKVTSISFDKNTDGYVKSLNFEGIKYSKRIHSTE